MTEAGELADISAVTRPYGYGGGYGDGFGFGGGGLWLFAILAMMMFGGNGFAGNRFNNAIGYENLATSNEVQRGFDNQNAMANQREILAAVTSGTAQSVAATNQSFHDMLSVVSDKYNEITRDIAGVAVAQQQSIANQNQCCCDTKMLIQEAAAATNANIAQSRYDAALNTAAINANTTANTQKILDVLAQNKIEALQGRVHQLELDRAVSGVVRYPNSMAYNAGTSPFCNCGCGCPQYA
jgi:hypothetical protein